MSMLPQPVCIFLSCMPKSSCIVRNLRPFPHICHHRTSPICPSPALACRTRHSSDSSTKTFLLTCHWTPTCPARTSHYFHSHDAPTRKRWSWSISRYIFRVTSAIDRSGDTNIHNIVTPLRTPIRAQLQTPNTTLLILYFKPRPHVFQPMHLSPVLGRATLSFKPKTARAVQKRSYKSSSTSTWLASENLYTAYTRSRRSDPSSCRTLKHSSTHQTTVQTPSSKKSVISVGVITLRRAGFSICVDS